MRGFNSRTSPKALLPPYYSPKITSLFVAPFGLKKIIKKHIDMFHKNVIRQYIVRVYMKKIVSTMFKYGAIFASLTTAFADKDFDGTKSAIVSEPKQKETSTWKGIFEQFLLENDPSLETKCQLLWYIADAIEGIFREAKVLGKMPNWNLAPNHIHMFLRQEPYVLYFNFLENSTSTQYVYDPKLFSEKPRIAFACLMLYVTHPELRSYFEQNKMRIYEGKFQRYSESRNAWVYLESDFTSSRLATLFLNEELTWEQIMACLESYKTYAYLIDMLKIAAMGTTREEREVARIEAEKLMSDNLFHVLEKDVPELLYTAILLKFLDAENKEGFCQKANEHLEIAKILLNTCSTNPYRLICKEKGETQISKPAMEILKKWQRDCLINALKIAANGTTREERIKARQIEIILMTKNQRTSLKINYQKWLFKSTLLHALDQENESMFNKMIDDYWEEANEILNQCSNNEIQISPKAVEMLKKWQYEYLLRKLREACACTREERDKARNIVSKILTEELQYRLHKNYQKLLDEVMMIQALDLGLKEEFREYADGYGIEKSEFVEKFCTESDENKIVISESAMKMLLDWYGYPPAPAA